VVDVIKFLEEISKFEISEKWFSARKIPFYLKLKVYMPCLDKITLTLSTSFQINEVLSLILYFIVWGEIEISSEKSFTTLSPGGNPMKHLRVYFTNYE